ncbi:methyltransferase domain-containing protein [Phyllobacterium sp. SB3]|uniref:class I SAM-dependent methyltransferase n=1 Tax=Phyllobacterium sp. SB3 TaxID=3156073 RepID=UPI0032AF59E4
MNIDTLRALGNIQLDSKGGNDISNLPIAGTRPPKDDEAGYWSKRSNDRMYLMAVLFANFYTRRKETVADVGCHCSPLVLMLPDFKRRFAFDPSPQAAKAWADVDGATFVNSILAPEMVRPLINDDKFDLVICNQVIEHLEEPEEFATTLCNVSRKLILSTTFETEKGVIEGHVQDPISLDKFEGWFPRKMQQCFISRGPTVHKILAVF